MVWMMWRLSAGFLSALTVGACFAGGFVQGLPCTSDADCGPGLRCVKDEEAEGLCGGPGETALCGNGLRDEGEVCDDGNTVDGDGCSKDCRLPECGDGVVDAGEDCDDPDMAEDGACTPACKLPVCGDGFDGPGEDCDDGNDVETDECTSVCTSSPEKPTLALSLAQVKQFDFTWASRGAAYHRLFERADEDAEFVQVGDDIVGASVSLTVPLHFRVQASYKLMACNALNSCVESEVVPVTGTLVEAIGYFKASNTDPGDIFGETVALSGDGNTLAVGAPFEASAANGIDGDQDDNSLGKSGAVYVFVRSGDTWTQQAYVKSSAPSYLGVFGDVALSYDGNTLVVAAKTGNQVYIETFARADETWSPQDTLLTEIDAGDSPVSMALSGDGDTLSVGVPKADAVATFVWTDGSWMEQTIVGPNPPEEFGNSVALSRDGGTLAVGASNDVGAVYVYTRTGTTWSQPTLITASNAGAGDLFGRSVTLSEDGDILAVGAPREDSRATGVDHDQDDDSVEDAGAAYVFVRSGDAWSKQAYIKASNTGMGAQFGGTVALSGDGHTLVVGAVHESSRAAGIGGDQANTQAEYAGAGYVFVWDEKAWVQRAYLKAAAPGLNYGFGASLAVSSDGETVVITSPNDSSTATGVGMKAIDDNAPAAGAVYLY